MLSEITYPEFLEWLAFAELEPFEEDRNDWRVAALRASIMETVRNRRKQRSPFQPKNFMLYFGEEIQAQKVRRNRTWQDLEKAGQLISSMFNKSNQRAAQAKKRPEPRSRKAL